MRLPTAFAVLFGLLVPLSAWAEPATKAPADPAQAEVSEVKPNDVKADNARAENVKADEAKPEEVEPEKAKPEQPKAPPARAPEEKPLDRKAPEPTSPPKTRPAGPVERIKEEIKQKEDEFPSPADLMRKMKAERDKRAQMPKVVYFDLSEAVGGRIGGLPGPPIG